MENDILDSHEFLIGEELEGDDFHYVEEDQENENIGPSFVPYPSSTGSKNNDLIRNSRIGELASNKAGLQGIDKEKVKQIIYEASKNSAFYLNEEKKDEALSIKLKQMMIKYESLKKQNLSVINSKVDNLIQVAERERDLSHIIVHIDMDAFYASIEERDNPSLRNKPMAVGDNSMLTTSNYEARNYGVRSAMPGFIAKKLCPELIIVPCNFDKYRAVSKQIREIFSRYDPDYTPMSLDEAYLDITKYLETTDKSPDNVVEQIRREIHEETKLTASAGIAANKLLAKICSDLNKPNGQYRLQNNVDDIMNFVRPLSVRKIPGIGRVTERILNEMDIKTCGAILDNRVYIHQMFSSSSFNFFIRVALGIGSTIVKTTFSSLSRPDDLYEKLRELADHLAADLLKERIQGKTIAITFKLVNFKLITRERSVKKYIHTADDIYNIGKQILTDELPLNLRLLGIRLSNLISRDCENGLKMWFSQQQNQPQQPKISQPSLELLVKPKAESNGLKRWFSDAAQQNNRVKRQHITSSESSTNFPTNFEFTTEPSNLTKVTSEEYKWCPTPTIFRKHTCPSCNKLFLNVSNLHFNDHLDTCLKITEMDEINDRNMDRLNLSVQDTIVMNEHNNDENAKDDIEAQPIVADWECPKCYKIFKNPTNLRINSHLDNCLKKSCAANDRYD
ncbi:980_t:CDS:2 [Gigaspora margarita]|uniref:DNA polymerase kappa n=1 Tax=Gigaspora margarita TaxID=4874 RepID=A0ABM8W0K5_GIGMA|nr:980_t:CDS:2 [Gigaspora margarita]